MPDWGRLRYQAAAVVRDWAYAVPQWLRTAVGGGDPDRLREVAEPCGAPVVIVPGMLESWRFQEPLAKALHAAGHPVHLIPALQLNHRGLERSSRIVADYLRGRDLTGCVIVAHSKGGLIAKELLLDAEVGPRLAGVVAVATPFGGSAWARGLRGRVPLAMYSPTGRVIRRLSQEHEVNGRIISLAADWDEVILGSASLAGARNATLAEAGHFLPLRSSVVHDMIHRYVDELAGGSEVEVPVIAIAAVGRNGAIGVAGDVPWRIPEDWKRFKEVTMGGTMIMGRKTFDSIGKPLPGRTSIVITRQLPELRDLTIGDTTPPTRVLWVSSLDEAFAAADPASTIWIGGGAEIYRLAWDRITDLDLTEVDQAPEADAHFPEVDPAEWVEVSREPRDGYAFVRYRRR